MSHEWVRLRLRQLQREGTLRVSKRQSVNLDGRTCWTPVFRLE